MAVPKCKVSKSRRDSRAANWKIEAPGLVECPNCGYYGKEKVVEIKSKNKD